MLHIRVGTLAKASKAAEDLAAYFGQHNHRSYLQPQNNNNSTTSTNNTTHAGADSKESASSTPRPPHTPADTQVTNSPSLCVEL